MRTKTGTVTSKKMDKTLVVTVHSYKNHPIYKKRYRVSNKFYADNPEKGGLLFDVIASDGELEDYQKIRIIPKGCEQS